MIFFLIQIQFIYNLCFLYVFSLFKACPEAVVVSFIKDPSHFWVQRCADSRKLNTLYDSINRWCRSRDVHVDKHIPLEIGKPLKTTFV